MSYPGRVGEEKQFLSSHAAWVTRLMIRLLFLETNRHVCCYEVKGRKRQSVITRLPETELHSLSGKAEGFGCLRIVKHARRHHLQGNRSSYALTTALLDSVTYCTVVPVYSAHC